MLRTAILVLVALCSVLVVCTAKATRAAAVLIDHESTDLTTLSQAVIERAKNNLHIGYGHTSHGSQLTTGMSGLVGFINGGGLGLSCPENFFAYNNGGSDGALDLHDCFQPGDLGNPDRTTWAARTRTYLDDPANSDVNVIIWSWCGQADTTESNIDLYLNTMSQLEVDYPNVRFVYMTGHVNGCSTTGNLFLRNQQIRDYCMANDKILYDFADIESWDPDGNYYGDKLVDDACNYDSDDNGSRDRNWATDWQSSHAEGDDWYSCSSAHSQPLNANRKAYAAWALWSEIAALPKTLTWDNDAGDSDWFNRLNWDPDDEPDASDHRIVLSGSPAAASDVSADSGGSITVDGAGCTLTVGGSLSVGTQGAGSLRIGNQAALHVGGTVAIGTGGTMEIGPGDAAMSAPLENSGTVNVQRGNTLTLSGAVTGPGSYTGRGTLVFEDSVSPGNGTALVPFAGDVRFSATATYEVETAGWDLDEVADPWDPVPPTGPINDRIHLEQGDATLGGRLDLIAREKLAPPQPSPARPEMDREWFGDQVRTLVSTEAAGMIHGRFDAIPQAQPERWFSDRIDPLTGEVQPGNWDQGHLGHGVFLTRGGPDAAGVEYTPRATLVHLFQAADGDTNGDRLICGTDIQQILAANKFGKTREELEAQEVWPAAWSEGDFDGNGVVNGSDISAILATNLFGAGPYTTPETVAAKGAAKPVQLIVTPEGLLLDAGAVTINGYVLTSRAGVFTGEAAENLGLFREDTDTLISGNLAFELRGKHWLGGVIGEEFSGVDPWKDLMLLYTVDGNPGLYPANLVVPEPDSLVLLGAALLAGLAGRFRRRRRP
ncbi:MAG: PEP-CTERM sorting domain-containing protein [Pirellulales bacterium]|nr:PEP-CTERM sorting domain-containing protein [Pirellulales bacterium]